MAQPNGASWGRPQTTAGGTQQWEPLPGFGAPRAEYANADELLTPEGQDALLEAYRAGLGCLISKTSDGGALSLTTYDGDRRYRSYAANADEAEALWEALGALARSKMPPPTTQPLETLVQPPGSRKGPRQRQAQPLAPKRTRTRNQS